MGRHCDDPRRRRHVELKSRVLTQLRHAALARRQEDARLGRRNAVDQADPPQRVIEFRQACRFDERHHIPAPVRRLQRAHFGKTAQGWQ